MPQLRWTEVANDSLWQGGCWAASIYSMNTCAGPMEAINVLSVGRQREEEQLLCLNSSSEVKDLLLSLYRRV